MKRNCVKGYSCGATCINRERNCTKELTGQPVSLASSLASLIIDSPTKKIESQGDPKFGKQIGKGAFGVVSLSEDGKSAYKIDKAKKPKQDLFAEAEITKRAGELGIGPKVIDQGTLKSGQKYMQMEYLKDYVPIAKVERTQELRNKIAEVLEKLYDAKIYHEDIHDRNILINSQGDLKIIDYGKVRKSEPVLGKKKYIQDQLVQIDFKD